MASRLVDYGSNGLIGVLTPQANTTVEPEFWSLLPPGWSLLNARLTSQLDTIEKRLVDYTANFMTTAREFANAPVEAVTIACTGASYLIGKDEESRITQEMEDEFQIPCMTSAQAAVAALNDMGAKGIALLTPYPESLNKLSTPYWESQGFNVVVKAGPALEQDAFHPIYAMPDEGVFRTYEQLSKSNADVVLMLGTGMATLGPLLRGVEQGLMPALSCNLVLVWHAINSIKSELMEKSELTAWRRGDHWQERFRSITARSVGDRAITSS